MESGRKEGRTVVRGEQEGVEAAKRREGRGEGEGEGGGV